MKIGDAVSGLLAALLGAAVVIEARTFPPMPGQPVGPSLFPLLIGAWLIVSGAALIFATLRTRVGRAEVPLPARHATLNLALVLAGLLFYALAVNRLGFLVTGTVFLSLLFLVFGIRRARILPLAIVVTLAVHYAFYTLLRVPLPWGVLEGIAW
jgi:putative tricarboxylic transport membrane protein